MACFINDRKLKNVYFQKHIILVCKEKYCLVSFKFLIDDGKFCRKSFWVPDPKGCLPENEVRKMSTR